MCYSLINQVEDRIRGFEHLASIQRERFFLACLWAWKELANR